ncbi:protein SHQ1 homolog [Saccostrea echinata]|uniref:protein SHQ1 homolog n=1 Tax=Saccostrea echinata TaxID=191078 RepID=UPI002A837F5D|nr:protein SHQ1 homolog [Saccostrea echinata]
MLTPDFQLKQDAETLTIIIKAPHARVTDTEIFIEGDEFRFHSKPYFLRLSLPGNIVENGREKAHYDSDKGVFTIEVPKETAGKMFEGLDMITSLLTPKTQKSNKPIIEVIGNGDKEEDKSQVDEEKEEDFDWYLEQKPYKENELSLDGPKYGFANQKSGVFKRLQDEVYDIVDLPDPENCSPTDRRTMREHAETEKFDLDHYIADLLDDESIQQIMKYEPPWCFEVGKKDTAKKIEFTDEEQQKMKSLPKKEYLLDDAMVTTLYLGLIDILFGYAYNVRINEGEENVESGWTICKLSATLSWLDTFTSVEEVLRSCMRRSLCFPLYRHWQLSTTVLKDVYCILTSGKKQILRCLLDIHTILNGSYPRYILNDLYITDYCVWIQNVSDKRLRSLASTLEKIQISKEDSGLDLVAFETCALDTKNDDTEETLVSSLTAVSIKRADNDSDDDTDDSTESYDSEDEGESDTEGTAQSESSMNK